MFFFTFMLIAIIAFIGHVLLLMSTSNRRPDHATYGYLIIAFCFWIKVLGYVFLIIWMFIVLSSLTFAISILITLLIYLLIDLAWSFYCTFIIYSYARFVAQGNWNAVEMVSGDNNLKLQLNFPGTGIVVGAAVTHPPSQQQQQNQGEFNSQNNQSTNNQNQNQNQTQNMNVSMNIGAEMTTQGDNREIALDGK